MSEYQYYEFQAVDRPLTHEAQEEMRRLSSRVALTASSASFVYNYGDFRGNPYDVLAKYFDAMLYITNWGTRQLMFRFPANGIPRNIMSDYQYADSFEWSTAGKYVILNIEHNDENRDDGWIEGEGSLSGLVQLRDDILRGDWRALYLAWLKFAHSEAEMLEAGEDLIEPPVPPNLQRLSLALRNLIAFFDLDDDLVLAAAQASQTAKRTDERLSRSIDRLSEAEARDFLERLLTGEPHLDIALANRLRELSGMSKADSTAGQRRTLRELFAASKVIRGQRLDTERREAEAARIKKLEKVAQRQEQLWARIPSLIDQKRANTYAEAVSILTDLHDLAIHQQRLPEFQNKLAAIMSQYPTLHGLHKRLRVAKLI
jgi:hypothetical protein